MSFICLLLLVYPACFVTLVLLRYAHTNSNISTASVSTLICSYHSRIIATRLSSDKAETIAFLCIYLFFIPIYIASRYVEKGSKQTRLFTQWGKVIYCSSKVKRFKLLDELLFPSFILFAFTGAGLCYYLRIYLTKCAI